MSSAADELRQAWYALPELERVVSELQSQPGDAAAQRYLEVARSMNIGDRTRRALDQIEKDFGLD